MKSARVVLLSTLLCACAGGPAARDGTVDPAIEQEAARRKAETEAPVNEQKLLLDLEKAMSDYAIAVNNQGNQRLDRQAQVLESYLRNTVERHFDRLLAFASDGAVPANLGIAVAALGFASPGRVAKAMPAILQGAQLSDQRLVDRAVFGLAMLEDPTTPPGVLFAIIEDDEHNLEGRVQAAWALYRLQSIGCHLQEIVPFWARLLARPLNAVPAGVLAQALRGIGLARDDKYVPLVVPHATNPTPWVRMMVALALARMNAQAQYEVLLAMLSPAETNANVRLYARTALRDLAGGNDRGYDVEQWRKVFDRSGDHAAPGENPDKK